MQLEKDEIVLISSGAYSAYSILDTFRTAKSFDTIKVLQHYLHLHPERAEEYEFEDSDFIAYLRRYGYVTELKTKEWYISSYGEADLTDDNST